MLAERLVRIEPRIQTRAGISDARIEKSDILFATRNESLQPGFVVSDSPSMSTPRARNAKPGDIVGTVLNLIFFGVTATTIVAVFFGIGILLLLHPREEMLATRSKTPEVTLIRPEQITAAQETMPTVPEKTPIPPGQTASTDEAAPTSPGQTVSRPEVAPTPPRQPPLPHEVMPNYSALAAATTVPLPVRPSSVATHAPPAAGQGTDEPKHDARLRFLRKQQARLEIQLTKPGLSAAETRRIERQKAYWGHAIKRMLASP
jgi:hypothetical protein